MPLKFSQAFLLLTSVTFCCQLICPVIGQNVYGCYSSGKSERRLTNYGKYTFIMTTLPPNATYLPPNLDCTIVIVGYSSSRWVITIDAINLGAYQASFSVYEGETTIGKTIVSLTNSSSVNRQFAVSTGSFTVVQTTKPSPTGLATGLRMTIEHLESTDCPVGWYSAGGSTSYCYGVPKMAGNLTYDQSGKACNMMLANLVMGNFDYDSISTELLTMPTSVVDSRLAYWVGMYMYDGNSEPKFLNKYTSMDSISGRLCSSSSSSCQCVAYQNRRFYTDDCDSRRQYICYMPRGGTVAYYDINSLVATTSAVVSIIAIVLTVGFILAVLISIIVVIVCCIRRSSSRRQNRCRSANTTGGAIVITSGNQPPYPTNGFLPPPPPPPMPEPAAPPYTISAPPYAVYSNYGFDAGASGAAPGSAVNPPDGAEKPPPYNPEWSGHQVPA